MFTDVWNLQANIEEYYCQRILKFTDMDIWKPEVKFHSADLEQK